MKIYEIPNERRYWVVRAENGRYFDHFSRHGLIALGHLNFLQLADSTAESPPIEWISLRDTFKKHNAVANDKKQRTSLHLSQVKSFLYEMSIGDWVITIGHGSVRFGRIIGKPFISKDPVTVVYDPKIGRKVDMDMHLRRKVEWGPSIARKNLPYGLMVSLKANQTVFCLDSKWDAIYHSLYPTFRKDNRLYLSAKIKAEKDIKNHSISLIFRLLDEIEVIGKEFVCTGDIKDFDRTFSEYIDGNHLTVTTKAQFHSPGEIWNSITALLGSGISIDHWATYTVAAYSMLFGNQRLGFDGLIDLETRQKIWDLVIDRIRKNRAEKVVESLQLELPNHDTSKLEDNSKDMP